MGGHGVPAGQPEEEPDLDHVEAAPAAASADAGHRHAGVHAGRAEASQLDRSVVRDHKHPSHRAAGRQFFDVGPLGL